LGRRDGMGQGAVQNLAPVVGTVWQSVEAPLRSATTAPRGDSGRHETGLRRLDPSSARRWLTHAGGFRGPQAQRRGFNRPSHRRHRRAKRRPGPDRADVVRNLCESWYSSCVAQQQPGNGSLTDECGHHARSILFPPTVILPQSSSALLQPPRHLLLAARHRHLTPAHQCRGLGVSGGGVHPARPVFVLLPNRRRHRAVAGGIL